MRTLNATVHLHASHGPTDGTVPMCPTVCGRPCDSVDTAYRGLDPEPGHLPDLSGGPVMRATGVIVLDRQTGSEYGLHDSCAPTLLALDEGTVVPDTRRLVEMGPLFAPESEWSCPVCGGAR